MRFLKTLCLPLLAPQLLAMAAPAMAQDAAPKAAVKRTYVKLTNDANALLIEPAQPNTRQHIVVINVHPDNLNTFEYLIGRIMAPRGYRVMEINYYGKEQTFEVFVPPIAAAIRYARSLPGVDKVILVGHSGGGPELTFYQEVAEQGPATCQRAERLYKCDGKGLSDLPRADAMLVLEANIGAPHRMMGMDPSILDNTSSPHDPALDGYAPANGFDPATRTAHYSPAFVQRYDAAMHGRSTRLNDAARLRLGALDAGKGLFSDDEPFLVVGNATSSLGPRLNLQDASLLAQTHGAHMLLKADGSRPVAVVPSTRQAAAPRPAQRDTMDDTVFNTTVKHYLSFSAITTGPDFAVTRNDIKGVDWRSSANSAVGSVEGITVPTLVMAGSCTIHMVPLEIVFDHAAARDKEFVVVEGGTHEFGPCRPEFGDSQKRAFDYVDDWLGKRFPSGG